jgi:hypothetical protein
MNCLHRRDVQTSNRIKEQDYDERSVVNQAKGPAKKNVTHTGKPEKLMKSRNKI